MKSKLTLGMALLASLLLTMSATAANVPLYSSGDDIFNVAPNAFTFDDFGGGQAIDTGTSILIDTATDITGNNGLFGGIGRDLSTQADFNASSHQVRIVYKTLPNNVANNFRIIIRDNDGDDSAPGLGTEDHQLYVDMSFATPLGGGSTFSEQYVALTLYGNPVYRDKSFGFANDGDTILNPGLDQWQVQSAFGGTDRLNIEIQSIEITPIPEPGSGMCFLAGLPVALFIRRRIAL